ncbi:MAG: DUF4292 domain-containing protein [Pseudomonadota bacterium]
MRRSLLLILPCFLAAACSGPVRLPETPIEDPGVLLKTLRGKAQPRTLYLYARAEYYSDQGVRKGKLLFMAGAPDRIHVEALSPTDDMLSLLASPGGEFVYFERGGKRCIRGTTCPENTGRFLPVPLSIPQVIGLLVGQPPVIEHKGATLKLRRRTGLYELRLEDPVSGTTQLLKVDPFDFDVVSTTIAREADDLKVRLDFEDYRTQGAYRLPRKIRALLDQDDTDLSLDVREVETDLDFKGDPFTVLCPRGAAVERALCPNEIPTLDDGGEDD